MCFKKTNRPENGLPAGLYSLIQLEFRDESGGGEQPHEGVDAEAALISLSQIHAI